MRQTRDAERSRALILTSAEKHFATRGFDGTTLDMIGRSAGVSRGLPSYLFASKAGLYEAVLENVILNREGYLSRRVGELSDRLDNEEMAASPELLRAVTAGLYDAYHSYLRSSPRYVQLMQREAVAGGSRLAAVRARLQAPTSNFAANELLTAVLSRALGSDAPREAARHLLLSLTSLVLLPEEHQHTLLRSLDFDGRDSEFEAVRRELAIEMLLAGFRAFSRKSLVDPGARPAPVNA